MQDTMEVQKVSTPSLRPAKEILQPFIEKERVHSIDPFEVYERFERAAIFAIIQAQTEAIEVMKKMGDKIFEQLKK